MTLADRTARELQQDIAAGTISAVDACRAALDRMSAVNPSLNAFNYIADERAVARAAAIDRMRAAGERLGPLAGVPIALKDNICVRGMRTTASSKILDTFKPQYDATVVKRLEAAGAVIVGKTNCDEFAMGSSNENSAYGPVRNPWNLDTTPGGSSGGSAAAVANHTAIAALGSDTGGSIRQPAGLCNLVGMKPTYGRVSRYGLVAFASSLDQIGPLTRTVRDGALVLNAICGHDPLDSTSSTATAEDFVARLDEPVRGLTLGVPRQARDPANHPAVAAALERAISLYASLGARLVEVDLPHTPHGIAAYYIIAPAEASSNLARYDGVRYGRRAEPRAGEGLEELYSRSRAEGFGAEVQRRVMLGTHVLSSGYYDAYYATAMKVRRLIRDDYRRAFAGGCHALLLPSSPEPAFEIGTKVGDPLALYLEDVYTVGVNLAGLPGITVPGGFAEVGPATLPVGIQLVGAAMDEARLLRIARMFEDQTGHWRRVPA